MSEFPPKCTLRPIDVQKYAKLTEDQWDDLRLEILYTIELGELRDTLEELEFRI